MRKLFFLSTLFYCINSSIHAQALLANITYTTAVKNASSNLIFYTSKQKLSIDDFESTPNAGMNAVAITSSGFAFNAGFHSSANTATALNIQVYCSFDKNRSWMKEAGKNNYILGHEQLHFDITYLTTLLFIKKLKQTKFTASNYSKLIEKIYNDAATELEAMQIRYDNETMIGRLKDKQLEWSEKISGALQNARNE